MQIWNTVAESELGVLGAEYAGASSLCSLPRSVRKHLSLNLMAQS